MATAQAEEAEYESDPEDAPLPSMRRREASDDEDGEGSDGGSPSLRMEPRRYDGDLDGQGGAPAYDEEEFEEEYEEELEEEEEEAEEEELEVEERVSGGYGPSGGEVERSPVASVPVMPILEAGRDGQSLGGEVAEYQESEPVEEVEEEEKVNEPYAVPTAGAFYMHDDRFQENGRGRHRRMPGGRKLWESKDNHAWVHDRFEEMNLQEAHYNEGRRMPRGRFRGRGSGKTRGTDGGFGRGNRSRSYYDRGNNQNQAPKSVRGRGPRRYVPTPKNKSEAVTTQQKQSMMPQEPTPSNTVKRQSQELNVQPELALSRKHVFASSLNSASPPFYPSGSSSQEISLSHKRNTQPGSTNKASSSSLQMEDHLQATQSVSFLKGKAIVDTIHNDMLYKNASLPQTVGRPFVNPSLQSSRSSISSSMAQSSFSVGQGKGLSRGLPNYQQTQPLNQVTRGPSQIHSPIIQQRQAQAPFQPAIRTLTPPLGLRLGSGHQASTPPQLPSTNSFELVVMDSPSSSNKSKTQLVEKGKTNNQGSGKGAFLYNGAQIIGASGPMGLPHGDQGFPATPALLPVMQFGGQHPGGLGVTAVGMALPGYVAQSQHGLGNSEMTWVPVLTGASGALGASYSPYLALDSSYYGRPSGQTSSSVSSRESSAAKPATTWSPPQRSETINDEFGQRQNKPRRYSEMNFGQ